jgi:DNA-binding XRE family transcriptional regulator
MAPFPVYDTEYVEEVKNTIMKLENENKIDYNDEPVVACKYCKSLHIVIDEVDNNICMRCGSVNELKEFKNIHEYKNFVNDENT